MILIRLIFFRQLFFKHEKFHANRSKTDVLCTWNGPSNTIGIVRVKEVADMLFPSRKENPDIIPSLIPAASPDEILNFLGKVKRKCCKAPVACYIAKNLNREF